MATTKNNTVNSPATVTTKPGPSEDKIEKCSICCVEPVSNHIVKDRNYETMIKFYFESVEVDVKPAEFRKQSLCTECVDMLVEFFDTNDMLVILGREFNKAKQRLLNTVERGIESCREQKKPLTPIQQTILEGLASLISKVKINLIKEEPADGFDQAYSFRSYIKPPPSKSKNANAESSDNNERSDSREKIGTSSKSAGGMKRRRDASPEGASDLQRSPEKAQPSRKLPARNKAKPPKYNENDSDNGSNDDDASMMSTVKISIKDDEDDNQCKVCSQTFPNKADQIKHMREMHTNGKNKYPCSTCRKVFEKCNELTEHKKSCPTRRRGK